MIKRINTFYNIFYYFILILALFSVSGKCISLLITVTSNNIIPIFLICTSFSILSSIPLHHLIVLVQNRLVKH